MNRLNNNLIAYPVNVERIYDVNKSINKLISNIHIKFDILCDCTLPRGSKIEILEPKFKYNLCNIKKSILVNGYKVDVCCNNIVDIIYLDNRYINLVDESCKQLCIGITEEIEANLKIDACIKCIAHTCSGNKIYFDAIGEGIDNISTIFTSQSLIPNFNKKSDCPYLILQNRIIGIAKPEYIYLSPIYGLFCNISNLLGNVFVNYCVNFELKTIVPCCIDLLCKRC